METNTDRKSQIENFVASNPTCCFEHVHAHFAPMSPAEFDAAIDLRPDCSYDCSDGDGCPSAC